MTHRDSSSVYAAIIFCSSSVHNRNFLSFINQCNVMFHLSVFQESLQYGSVRVTQFDELACLDSVHATSSSLHVNSEL